ESDRGCRSHVSHELPRARRLAVFQRQRTGAARARSIAPGSLSARCGLSLPQFKLLRPRAIEEAISFLSQKTANIGGRAGGTALIPSMRQSLFEPEYVLDLREIAA